MYSLRRRLCHGTSSMRVWTTSTLRSRARIASASAGSAVDAARQLDRDGQRRLLLDARQRRLDEYVAADVRFERAHDLADRRWEDVDAAHDDHVVRAPDAADPRPRAAASARTRTHLDLVARAEAQQRRRAMTQVRQHQLAGGAVLHRDRDARLGVDQLRVDEAARAEVHPVLLLALAPERHADVADPHRLGHARAPAMLEHRAEGRLPASRLAGHEHALDARPAEVEVALRRPFDEIRGVGGREHDGLGPQQLDGAHQPLRVPGADRDVGQPEAVEGRQRRPGDERPGVVGADDAAGRRRRRTRRSCVPIR